MPAFKPPLYIVPTLPKTSPSGQVQLTAIAGSGSGYAFTIVTNNSGGTVNSGSGLYTAGTNSNCTDVVQVTDGIGLTALREVQVMDGPTLGQIRLECQQRLDLVNSSFIGNPEWLSYINGSAFELYDKLVYAYGANYNLAPPYIFTTDGQSEFYPLPIDLYKHLGLDVQIANTTSGYLPVPRFNFAERNKFMVPYQVFYGIRTNLHYEIAGSKLWVLPIAAAGQNMRLHYVPRFTKLMNDTDVLDGLSGWEDYVKVDVCIKAGNKRETDVSVFMAQKSELGQRIDEIAIERDIGSPATVVDTRAVEDDWMNRGGSGGPF